MTKDEALKLALEALDNLLYWDNGKPEYDEAREAITACQQALTAQPAPVQEPVGWKWHQAPVKTSWGHEMVVADLAIDKDNTVSVYCERDQTAKVEAMFNPPAQPAVQPMAHIVGEIDHTGKVWKPVQPALVQPVAWISAVTGDLTMQDMSHTVSWAPLYTTPPAAAVQEGRDWSLLEATQESLREHMAEIKRLKEAQRQWVGLTNEEMYLNCPNWLSHEQCKTWVRQIEAELKEKNT